MIIELVPSGIPTEKSGLGSERIPSSFPKPAHNKHMLKLFLCMNNKGIWFLAVSISRHRVIACKISDVLKQNQSMKPCIMYAMNEQAMHSFCRVLLGAMRPEFEFHYICLGCVPVLDFSISIAILKHQ